ncbi:hypothetical protein [Nocardioides houyundeii]|uniref:hypothetical protein n=1 Tax=Nocardioides houyundeii TaxID=2045452 RepID=UPI000DF4AB90|nr:hypothetical protein [Nocardioides houyundeii]
MTVDVEDGPARPRPKRRRGGTTGPFSSPVGLLAVAIISVQAIWRGGPLARGFFTQDDYVVLQRAANQPLDTTYLGETFAGERSPVANLLVWLLTWAAPMEWGGAVLLVLVLQALTAGTLWLVLTRLLGDRWVRIPLLAVLCFTPLALGSTYWFSLAMLHLPVALLFLVAVLALLSHVQDDWESGPVLAGAALAAVLLGGDDTLFLPVALFGLVASVMPPREAGYRSRLAFALSAYPRLWLFLLLAIAGRVVLGQVLDGENTFAWPAEGQAAVDVVQQYVRQSVSGLVGGPWRGEMSGTVLEPAKNWPLALAALAGLLILAPLVRVRRPAGVVPLAVLAVCFVGGALLLVGTHDVSYVGGMVPRLLADLVPVAVVLVAAALRVTTAPPQLAAGVRRVPAVAAMGLALALTCSAAVTAREVVPHLQNEDDRAFVANIADGLEMDPRIVLLDGPVPEGVMSSLFGGEARVSTVTGLLPEVPSFDLPSEFLRMVDGNGYVRDIDLFAPVSARPSRDKTCGYPARAEPVVIALEEPVAAGPKVLRMGYYTSMDTFAVVEIAGERIRVPIAVGAHTVQVPVAQAFDRLSVTLETLETTLCVTDVAVGAPTPAPLPALG